MKLDFLSAYQSINGITKEMAQNLYGHRNLTSITDEVVEPDAPNKDAVAVEILSKVIQVAFVVFAGLAIYTTLVAPVALSLGLGVAGLAFGVAMNPAKAAKLLKGVEKLEKQHPFVALILNGVASVCVGSFILSVTAGLLARRFALMR